MGIKIVVPGKITVPRPILYADPRLNAGSLVLVDPAHPEAPLAGTPAPNDRLTNLASDGAQVLAGSGEVRPQLVGTGWGSSYGIIERSGLGGLHVAVKHGIATDATHGIYLTLNTLLQAYMIANPTHSYHASVWGRVTRTSGESVDSRRSPLSIAAKGGNEGGDYAYYMKAGIARPNGATLIGSAGSPIADTVATFRSSLGINGFVGSVTNLSSSRVASWGNTFATNRTPDPLSWILYSAHVCDLTVAGLTYAQQDAIDAAEYTRQISTAGGRYFGTDTYTDPATI